jgi:hypothetical protein
MRLDPAVARTSGGNKWYGKALEKKKSLET